VRAVSYITRTGQAGVELLAFTYDRHPEYGAHLPGGGVEPGERPDHAAIREAVEETGLQGSLSLLGVVGIQHGHSDVGEPTASLYFHLATDELRTQWTHTIVGDDDGWDTGLEVTCRFTPLAEATDQMAPNWHQLNEFIDRLTCPTGQTLNRQVA
jgi:8-oxo-dGTP pyrophosphatase MutT (NUDIX family)